jgi:nitrite reductase (NADH) small subunit
MSAVASPSIGVCLGSPQDIPLGQGRIYLVDGQALAVFRRRDGRIFTLENVCPHRGGPLADGLLGDGEVVCPLHGWRFDLETGRGLTDPCGVRSFATRVVAGLVYVFLSTGSDADYWVERNADEQS